MRFASICSSCLAAAATLAFAQQRTVTLPQAVAEAAEKYPATRASLEQVSAAAAGIQLARTSYLPRADFLAAANRATFNNVLGLTYPQPVLPGISGPVLDTGHPNRNVFGSAVGLTVSWEPFDFGFRKANIDSAAAGRSRAEAAAERTRFEVRAAAADACLTILAAQQAAAAARAGLDRARILAQVIDALVKAELKPGADLSRSRAESAMAEMQLIKAEQAVAESKASLGRLLGAQGSELDLAPGPFLQAPRVLDPQSAVAAHPLAKEQTAAIEEVKARERALEKSWYPRVNLQASSYARGTGARLDGETGGFLSGLGPNIHNWAFGFNVTFPALEQPALKQKKLIEQHHERAESARYRQLMQDLNAGVEKARANLEASRRIADTIPAQLQAARDTLDQAAARYKAGLGNLIDVADAQRLLTQTEIDESLARLNVWRAMLGLSVAQGDMDKFLELAQ